MKRLTSLVVLFILAGCAFSPFASAPSSVTSFGSWKLRDVYDPSAPQLIVPDGEKYRLSGDWRPTHIDYYFRITKYDPDLNKITVVSLDSTDGIFKREGKPVAPEAIQNLLASIRDLYPVQGYLYGYPSGDITPVWQVELSDARGATIVLSAASAGNPDGGPWNVYYNGRLYAQYGGGVSAAVARLVPDNAELPLSNESAITRESDQVYLLHPLQYIFPPMITCLR